MKRFIRILSISLLINAQLGCSFFGLGKTALHNEPSALEARKVFFPDRLRSGATIAIIPFNPGRGVAADAELDRIALMLIKGVADIFDTDPRFQLLVGEEADKADFILQGHILRKEKIKKKTGFFKGTDEFILDADAELIDRAQGDVVVFFRGQKTLGDEGVSFGQCAFLLGHELANFIVEQQ